LRGAGRLAGPGTWVLRHRRRTRGASQPGRAFVPVRVREVRARRDELAETLAAGRGASW